MARFAARLLVALRARVPAALTGRRRPTPRADARRAATCTKEAKRLKTFQRGMKAAKRRFFRTHRSAKARKRFTARQKRTLAAPASARSGGCSRGQPRPRPGPGARPRPGAARAGSRARARPRPRPPTPRRPEPPARDFIEDVFSPAARVRRRPRSRPRTASSTCARSSSSSSRPAPPKAAMDALLARLGAAGRLLARRASACSPSASRTRAASRPPARWSRGSPRDPALTAAQLATVPVTTELPEHHHARRRRPRPAAARLARLRRVERPRGA